MAKDSFILSQTRGGVGNLVVRRSNGKTIVSAKPTSVSNPRTYAQAETRMRLSAVSAFYSPLSTVLQQGVQGKNTPNSHSAFSSEAIGIMKAGGYAFPKGGGFFPYPFRLTRGSIPSVGATMLTNGDGMSIYYAVPSQAGIDYTSVGGFTYYLQSVLGIDATKFQATFIVVERRQVGGISQFFPRYFRVACDRSSNVAIADVVPSFIVVEQVVGGDDDFVFGFPSTIDVVACAIIVSYYDGRKWLRSTEFLNVLPDVLADRSSAEAFDLAVSSFMSAASSNDPDGRVYLDGYTRRAGGDEPEPGVDWSAYTIAIGSEASTAKIESVGVGTLSGQEVIFVTLDDDRNLVLQGNDKMNAYGKAFRADGGTKVTIPEGTNAVSVTSEPGYYDFYAAVADLFDLPVSYMFT